MKNGKGLACFIASVSLALTPYALKGATVTIISGDQANVGFNDPTAVSPVGGNNGTTLGQQRMIAFQAAADKWGATLASNVTIRVSAVWTALTCSANAAVLGSAGPAQIFRDFPGAPVGAHWYPKALANKIVGSDVAPASVDISANFNVNVGQAGCLTNHFFYLGLDNNHGNNPDLITVVTHEFGHGLGFLTFTNGQTGAQAGGFPSIWDDFLLDNNTNKTWSMMTDAERAASAVNGHLVWNGGNLTSAIPQVLQPAGSSFAGADTQARGLMFSPGSFQAGSSVSHFDSSMTRNQLMEPGLSSDLTHEVTPPQDLTFPLLKDIGWAAGSGGSNPDLTLSKTHVGNFTQGQASASYTITATNSGTGPTSGTVTVTDTLPNGLTATAIGGTNWNCTQPSGPCSRSDALAAGSSYQVITLTVKVAANAPVSVTNTATISGGGELNTANDTASDLTGIVQLPSLTISSNHSGSFQQGQTGATYTVTVSNVGGGATSGIVTVTESVPAGLTLVSMSGSGWTCTVLPVCANANPLAAGASYSPITVTVNVLPNATSPQVNAVSVSGGGSAGANTNDSTTITTNSAVLSIVKTHSGSFTQGQQNATYQVTVTNAVNAGTTSGTVTVTESVPAGLTLVSMSGSGWTCTVLPSCTTSTPLAGGASYSPITVTVNVTANATSPQVNAVSVSGGGSAGANTNDSTAITPKPPVLSIAKTHNGSFAQGQQNATYQVTVTNAANAGTTSGTVTVTESVPAGLNLVSMSGAGWTCTVLPNCTNSTPLAGGASYSPITVNVNVTANATSPQVNAVSVSGGGSAGANTNDSTAITNNPAVLSIVKTHSGSFTQGQQNATYQVTVTNAANAGITSGTVTVTESVPAGLTLVSMSGAGWTCTVLPNCTNSTPLAGGTSYSPITVTVNVTANATSPQVNAVSVSGGGSAGANTNDSTNITATARPPVLSIVKTHSGSFTQGQQNATYQVTVTNAANAGTTSGVVTVIESVPSGLLPVSMTGTGWTCEVLPVCTNPNPLAGGASYSPITVTVNVTANAASPQVNSVSVSGGGSAGANTSDSTTITAVTPNLPVLSIASAHGASFTQGQQNATYQLTVSNAAGAGSTGGTVTVTDTMPAGLSLVSMSGAGWTCTVLPTCTNGASLAGGASYPAITVTVNVAANAVSPQVHIVSVSGGGSLTASTNDAIPIVSHASGPPLPTEASPSSGNSSNPAITFTFTDPRGYQDLGVVNVLVNNFLDGRNACYLAYSQPSGVLYLVDDLGGLLPGAVLMSSGNRNNSQCTVSWDSNAVSGAGNTLTLTLTITFKPAFAGNKVIYAAARDVVENNSGWVALGVWTVPGAVQPGTTAALGMTPARGTGLGPTPVTFNFSDTKGFQDLGVENILVNNFLDGRHACYLAYARSINTLYLVNDNGDGLLPGKDLGTSGSLSNGQCTVNWGSSPVTAGGNNLSLTLNMAFSPNFAGGRVFYLAARDVNEANNTDWQSLGTWLVQ